MASTKSKSKSTTRVVAKRRRTRNRPKTRFVRVIVETGTGGRSFSIRGATGAQTFKALRDAFGDRVEVIHEPDQPVEIRRTDFYRHMKKHMTPGKHLRVYRERNGWSQRELGTRLGNLQRQHISRLERDERGISKELAKRLAELFDVPVERFL